MHYLRSYFVCQFSDCGYFSTTWLLKQVKESLADEENFYWLNWVETFLKWKAKALYGRKTVRKKAKPLVEIVTYLSHRNLIVSSATSVKDAGGGWNSSRKNTMTYIVVKIAGRRHKKWSEEKYATSQNFLLLSVRFSTNDRNNPFCFAIALETLWMAVHAANTNTPN